MKSVFFDFKNTRVSINRSLGSYTKIQLIYGMIIRGMGFQLDRIKCSNSGKYLNVGCGNNMTQGFINIDYHWKPKLDLCWDITRGLPYQANSVKGIFTEHCLEHITYSQCQTVLTDFYRILQPRGTLRIIVPDAELYLDLYWMEKHGEKVTFPYVTTEDLEVGFSPIISVNRVFRDHGHLYAYDYRVLKQMLEKVGFGGIRKAEFMCGRNSELLIDSESRKIESLYVEAEKLA